MKRAPKCYAILAAILLLASCSSVTTFTWFNTLSSGEARLTGIEMPEYVREDLPYDVILRIDSEETPQIRRACFRWLTEEISTNSPSLYCYAMHGTFGTGGPCTSWTSGGSTGSVSFCVDASDIRTDVPGRLYVKVRPVGLKAAYNKLEAQVEYASDGQVRLTNTVKTPVIVEQ
ncbi:MAG: hypothetical protein ABSG91_10370 [Syntrophobacteraceae bacterium]|jgi:hypothetical protein